MSLPSPAPAIRLETLTFGWRPGLTTLDIPAFEVGAGERVFLRGPSGSGKSTLLSLVSGVLTARSGRVSVLGQELGKLSASKRDALRGSQLGVIFQMFNLAPYLSVLENVALPCRFSAERRARTLRLGGSVEAEARRLLARLGLGDAALLSRKPADLSVGQQQRVAAARALIGAPGLILADEPTSALDTDARGAFIDLLSEECAARSAALLFVSHDMSLASRFDRAEDLRTLNRAAQAPTPQAAEA
jgi:putative ABC transport system ATP-binding protein